MSLLASRRPAAILAATGLATLVLFLVRPSVAYAAGVEEETAFVFNTFSFLVWGALVMWMCAGFTMLESGSVRTKNAAMICLKNIGLYSIAGLAYFFIGYNLMYGDIIGGVIGTPALMYMPSPAEVALLDAGEAEVAAATAKVLETGDGYSVMSDWFFQMVFVATAASIVSGALAERVKMWSFLPVHPHPDGDHLPHRRRVDVGRRLARQYGLHRLRRLDHRPQHRRLGRPRGYAGHRPATRQIPQGRVRPRDAPLEHPGRDARRLHPVVRVVRLQRRLAAWPSAAPPTRSR